jgi:transposase InsO family protein
MKQISDALQISRPNVIRRARLKKPLKREKYKKSEDEILLPLIREICATRPSYGYKRTTAILNRKLYLLNFNRVNHKRIYRIMRLHGLVLPRIHSKADRSHDGRIVTLCGHIPLWAIPQPGVYIIKIIGHCPIGN